VSERGARGARAASAKARAVAPRQTGRRVALTFDAEHPDRPNASAANAARILDALAEIDARATFFVQGRWARSQPDTLARIEKDGHLVGNHSNYHVRMSLLSDDGLRRDISQGEEAIRALGGPDPRPWFRCPFGDGRDEPRVLAAIEELGYREVGWDVELNDWEPWRTAGDIADDAVTGSLSRGDGAVVLLHAWPDHTAEAVPAILERLRDEGAELVRIDELDELP
jgi:peptidoglycan-N-acetylglucosamine deacetylase